MLNRYVKRSKTLRTKTRIFGIAFAFLALSLSALSAGFFHLNAKKAVAEPATSYTFENEDPEPMDSEDIASSVKKSTITDTSQSFSVEFSSSIKLYNNGRYNNVYVRITDPAFVESEAKAQSQANIDKAQAADNVNREYEYETPTYEASVFKICYQKNAGGNKNPTHIVIPEYINFLTTSVTYPAKEGEEKGETVTVYTYRLHVTAIGSGVPFSKNSTMAIEYGSIESITIPSSIQTIDDNAFPDAAEAGINFYCVDSEEEIENKAWADDWTDAPAENIHYGRTFDEETAYEDLNTLYTAPVNTSNQEIGKGDNYVLSSYPEDEALQAYRKPLVVEYNYLKDDTRLFYEVPLASPTATYDGIGSTIGSMTLTINVDLPKPVNDEVDPNSLVFHNIYPATKLDGYVGFFPDITKQSRIIHPKVLVSTPQYFSDMVSSYETTALSTFGDFTMVKVRFNFNAEAFLKFNHMSYAAHESEIESGALSVRYQLNSISSAKYIISYTGEGNENKSVTLKISTPISAVSLKDGAEFGFMINNTEVGPDFSPERMESLDLFGFSFHLDLYNSVKNNVANNSKVNVRYASLNLYTKEGSNLGIFSIPVAFVIAYAIYVVAYALIAVGLYIYRKNRYKNDEFRRVNKKKYMIETAKNFVGFAIVLSAILFIVGRWGWFNNGVVVFNPLDPGVIVFTVFGGIFIGFTIKNLVMAIRLGRERRKKQKLKLDLDIVEDGTN